MSPERVYGPYTLTGRRFYAIMGLRVTGAEVCQGWEGVGGVEKRFSCMDPKPCLLQGAQFKVLR